MGTAGQIIGGVVGAVAGFLLSGYNPYGAYVGFVLGSGIGSYIDPMKPDTDSGGPQIQELDITMAEEGMVIPHFLGTTKIKGNIVHYFESMSEEVMEEVESGKGGGSSTVVTGQNYYLSWLQALCLGPIDRLLTVYNGDDVIWLAFPKVSKI